MFGTGLSGTTVKGKGTTLNSPTTLAWVAHWNSSAKGGAPATLTVTRLNGPGPHPLVVWSAANVKAGAMTTTMLLTSKQMKAHNITVGGKFQVQYSSGSTVLATGTVSLSGGSTGVGTGY